MHAYAKPPVRILEAGCGDGTLARMLMDDGFTVIALDHSEEAVQEARAKGVSASQSDFLDFRTDEPFDVLIFSRSLHHIHPIETAVKHAHSLLVQDGMLLLEEFGAELMDDNSALWFYGLKSFIESDQEHADGHQKHNKRHGPKLEEGEIPADPLRSWSEHHFHKHGVADSKTMMAAFTKYFDVLEVSKKPYLFRYFIDDVSPAQADRIFQWETALCKANMITPIGIRFAGRKIEPR